ncbi:hypothetical protein [Anaeromyxobacter sp. SG17]|uniref:hypothetical protein n=1 Tax=Anaeromyxobacter sp. SG17 TaxID=2925405 RepID=UPI001F585A67|nr:hypothetical protein [Anaeromyxobacter sp. SG17]
MSARARRRGPAPAAALVALALGACGPYAEVAQKLDVTARVAGDTWIAADGAEVRVLLVGTSSSDGSTPFAFTSMQMPISAGTSASTLQGTWAETGSEGRATLRVEREYTLPDERTTSLLSRRGAWRTDERRTLQLTVIRDGGRLVLAGDAALAGTYAAFGAALARLGTATARDAACAFQIANLGIRSSEIRIIGFGGPGMTQYQRAETYVGTVAGNLRVSQSGFTHNTTTILYSAFEDLGGARVDGPQVTDANSGGDGHMSGVLTFVLQPRSPDGSAATPVTGSIDYGGAGNPADAVQISNGSASGGVYVVSIEGGGSARVSPETPPSPSVAECLRLP